LKTSPGYRRRFADETREPSVRDVARVALPRLSVEVEPDPIAFHRDVTRPERGDAKLPFFVA
jgi:hypothetical protein